MEEEIREILHVNNTRQAEHVTLTLDWQPDFLIYLEAKYRHKSGKTISLAMQHVNVFSLWWEAANGLEFRPDQLTSFDLGEYRRHSLEKARVSAATWNSRLWALRVLCEWLSAPDLAEELRIQKRGNGPARHRALTDSEYRQLVRQLELRERSAVTLFEGQKAVRDAAAIGLMLWAGLRVEEVAALDARDLEINERSGKVIVRHGKGDKERFIPLNALCRKVLAKWLSIRPQASTGALFQGKGTDRLSTRQLERTVKQAGYESRIPEVTPHWLRYTFAKRLEGGGATIEQVRDLLGHSTIETTRRYLRSGYDELQSLVEAI